MSADGEATRIPGYDHLGDDELMAMSGRAFALSVIERARTWALDVVDPGRCQVLDRGPQSRQEGIVIWCRYRAWAEWWNAVPPAAKQLVLLPDDDFDLKVRLGQQIIDEIKHQRAFTHHVHQMGGDGRIERFRPDDRYTRNSEAAVREDPLDIAVVLQCTGEVILNEYMRPEVSVLYRVLDEATARVVSQEVAREEPRHIQVGCDVVERHATTAESRRRVLRIQDAKFSRSWDRYLSDFDLLGIRRLAPAPVVA